MKRLTALTAAGLSSVLLCTCGSTHSTTRSPRTAAIAGIAVPDYDPDDGHPTDDDSPSALSFGADATQPARAAIARLVKGYLTAAKAGDGARGCALITPALAKSLPIDYGGSSGPPYLRGGKTCAEILSRLLQHERRQLLGEAHMTDVDSVRVEGDRGLAFIGKGKIPERLIVVQRVEGRWTMAVLVGGPMRHLE